MPDEQATPPRWRQRLIPKTALGISMIILAAALGSAFSRRDSLQLLRLPPQQERGARQSFRTRLRHTVPARPGHHRVRDGQGPERHPRPAQAARAVDRLRRHARAAAGEGLALALVRAHARRERWRVGRHCVRRRVRRSERLHGHVVHHRPRRDAQSRARRHGPPRHRGHQGHPMDVAGGAGPGAPRHPEARCAAPSVGRRQPADPHR